MMYLTLFAIIGALINAGTWYWIVFGLACALWLARVILEVLDEN